MSEPSDAELLSIAAVERETGVSKDTLRVWERRYGFPQPGRNAHGERVYPADQVARLHRIRRLMDRGLRPGRIFAMSNTELEAQATRTSTVAPRSALHDLALYLLKTHQTGELRRELTQAVVREGLYRFLTETAAPLAVLVGEAWTRGEIHVFEEHLFTEQLQAVLRQAIGQAHVASGAPRVLLSTPSGEQHGLGLLMAEAACTLEGAECVSLGVQTPVSEMLAAAIAKHPDIVALSVSASYPAAALHEAVVALRGALPAALELWCGGAGAARLKRPPAGVRVFSDLAQIGGALAEWRRTHAEAA